jgi:hypothetical protein
MESILWLLVPLIVINSYHAFMMYSVAKKTGYRNSISETAFHSTNTLTVYIMLHVVGALCFLVFAYLLYRDYSLVLPALFLFLAAVFDATQVMTLSKKTNHTPMYLRDFHQLSAWLMTICYLLFALSLLSVAGNYIAIVLFMLFLGHVYVASHMLKHRYFWFAQMAVFVSISMVMVIAAVRMATGGGQ